MGTLSTLILKTMIPVGLMMPILAQAASCDHQTSLIEGFLQRNKQWVEIENKNSTEIAKRNPILIDVNFRNPERTQILTFKDQGELITALKSRDYSAGKQQLSDISSICFKNNTLEIKTPQGNAKLFYTGEVLNARVSYGIFGDTFYFKKP